MEANMKYSTKYTTGNYQDLHPCGGCCKPPCFNPPNIVCPSPSPNRCGNNNEVFFFILGYLLAKEN